MAAGGSQDPMAGMDIFSLLQRAGMTEGHSVDRREVILSLRLAYTSWVPYAVCAPYLFRLLPSGDECSPQAVPPTC